MSENGKAVGPSTRKRPSSSYVKLSIPRDSPDDSRLTHTWTHIGSSSSGSFLIVERNKEDLRCILEEEGLDYGDDAMVDKELLARANEALRLRVENVAEVLRAANAARQLDLCFLIDVTGSMTMHIEGVRNSIHSIVDQLTKKNGASQSIVKKLRLAFVGYRDFTDPIHFEVLPFTPSVEEFHDFCTKIEAKGGGDFPEDVFGGLEQAAQLDWSSSSVDGAGCGATKVLFHMGDDPCHGRAFHNQDYDCHDKHPEGDPRHRTAEELFDQIATKGIQYHFGKITDYTDTMMEKFSQAYGYKVPVCDVQTADRIFDNVVSSTSIAVRGGIAAAARRRCSLDKKMLMNFDSAIPNWSKMPQHRGQITSYEWPESIEAIIAGVPLKPRQPLRVRLMRAEHPFAGGSEKVVYYGRLIAVESSKDGLTGVETAIDLAAADIVLKRYLNRKGRAKEEEVFNNSAAVYECGIKVQAIAAFLAANFNEVTKRVMAKENLHPIQFLNGRVLTIEGNKRRREKEETDDSGDRCFAKPISEYMICERRYPPGCDYLRFTNNLDYSMLEHTAKLKGVELMFVDQLMAFSHWSYQVSKGYLMVVDLQGIISRDAETGKPNKIELTDPAIHCTDLMRFGRTNLGVRGMKRFFGRHVCNEICKKMGLNRPTFPSDEN